MAASPRRKAGQSPVEILVAVGLFAVIAAALLLLVVEPLTSTSLSVQRTQAAFLAAQGVEAARAVKDKQWTGLTLGAHGVSRDGSGNWQFVGTSDVTD